MINLPESTPYRWARFHGAIILTIGSPTDLGLFHEGTLHPQLRRFPARPHHDWGEQRLGMSEENLDDHHA